MKRWMSVVVVVCTGMGCSAGTDPAPDGSTPETVLTAPSVSAFAGTWRSVTPSLEFIRLTVSSKSSEFGVLAARLTFSGVYWEGSGRIEGDSYVANVTMAGAAEATGVMVATVRDGQLRVELRPATGAKTEIAFVRDN